MPRRCGRQTRANHPADTTKQYWRIALYYPFLDHMVMELDSRLLKSEDRFLAEQFLSRFIDNITDNEEAIYNTYQSDLMLSLEDFKREIARWRTRCDITPKEQRPHTLCSALDYVNPTLYPSIDTILCIFY